MGFTISEIAAALGTDVLGDATMQIARASEPGSAGPDDLALAMSPAYGPALAQGQARAAILWPDADWQDLGLRAAIKVPRARLAMSAITRTLDPGPQIAPGIHASAVIDPSAHIGKNACIGPFVVIGAGVRIGANARILSHTSIAEHAQVGDDALIAHGVRIASHVTIGDRFTCQPGAVIGGDGFSFVTPQESGIERARRNVGDQGEITPQEWIRIHSLGSVSIGDDVEIGANACIDKGTVADTAIGDRTKLDNLVHIGHNNRIGADCLICGQVGLAGSSVIGDRVVLGGQVGVSDNITIGDDVVAGGASKIFTRVKAGEVILGHPAVAMKTSLAMQKALRRLPRLSQQFADLRKALPKPGASD